MSDSGYVPERGDAIWLQFNPQASSEQTDHRLALVISPKAYNKRVGLALLCPITSKVKGYPFEVGLPPGLDIGGVILSDQIKNLDWRTRQATFICTVPTNIVLEVVAKVAAIIDRD